MLAFGVVMPILPVLRRAIAGGGTRRQMLGTALAGLILGLGIVTAGTGLARAAESDGLVGFFERLFRAPETPAPVVAPPRPSRYATLPDARRVSGTRAASGYRRFASPRGEVPMSRRASLRRSAASTRAGTRTVCMRSCDGYLFPLGNLRAKSDIPIHEAACAAACPGGDTRLLTLGPGETELDRAVGLDGRPYRASALANVYRARRVAQCSCQPAEGAVALPLAQDRTLRRGDVVASEDSAEVVTRVRPGSLVLADYRRAQGLRKADARAIEAKVGAMRREAEGRAFRRALRLAESERVVLVASAGDGFAAVARSARPTAFAAVRVVAPSPYLR